MSNFSVVIPSYKTSYDQMYKTIKSVYNQTLLPFEIIIIDDNGGDNYSNSTKRIEKEFPELLRVLYNEKNMGANYSRNQGIKEAKGKFIAFLDSDDIWNDNYLELNYQIIKEEGAQFLTNNYQIVHKEGILPPEFNPKDFPNGNILSRELYRDYVGPTSTVIVSKDILLEAGLFDEKLPARQDYDMWLRVCKLVPLYYNYIPSVFVIRDGHDSISSSYIRNIKGTEMVLKKILSTNVLENDEIKLIKASHYKHMAMACILCNAYKESRKYIRISLKNKCSISLFVWYILSLFPSLFTFLRNLRKSILFK